MHKIRCLKLLLVKRQVENNKTSLLCFTMENNTTAVPPIICHMYLLDEKTSAIIKTVSLLILGLLSIISNILILAVLVKNREMRTTTNIFIANMALSDIMFGLMVIPKEIALQLSNHIWLVGGDFGSFSCKFVVFVQDVSTAVSIFSHIVIAIERFYAVVFPLRARRSGKYLRIFVVAATWFVSIGIYSIYFYNLKIVPAGDGYMCTKEWGDAFGDAKEVDRNHYLVSFSTQYAFPVLVIAILYCIVLYKLNCRHVVGNDLTIRSGREALQNKRVVRLAICIVCTFVVLQAPLHIMILHLFFKWKDTAPCGYENLFFTAFFLAWSSCFTNPLIYFIFSENYRNGLKNLLGNRLVIHPRIHPRVQVGETTEGGTTESRTRSTRTHRNERSNEETDA